MVGYNKFWVVSEGFGWFAALVVTRRSHIWLNHFEKVNWLPVKNRAGHCIAMTAYNFQDNLSIEYKSDIYTLNSSPFVRIRRSMDNFVEPIYMKEISRKSISCLGSKI